jgi:hypothetical protein
MAYMLDGIDGLTLGEELDATELNAVRSLAYLWSGLRFLDHQVSEIEKSLSSSLDLDKKVYFVLGNAPLLKDVPQGLIACAFHWYATSSCNFVRLVGWLAHGRNGHRADAYVGRIIPSVRVWRNKVGAHFAITDPRKEDTAAVLESSVMFPIGFVNGRFQTQPFIVSMRRGGKASSTRADMSWSLTDVHRLLAQRYEAFLTRPSQLTADG